MRGDVVLLTKVLIVEDEEDVREEYKRQMENHAGLCLAGEADCARDATAILKSTQVDAVILDLELNGDDGISFLRNMQELRGEKPFVLVVTKVVSRAISELAHKCGADYVYIKAGKDFTPDEPLTLVEMGAPYRGSKESARAHADEVNLQTKKEIYRKRIQATLEEMGFPGRRCGTSQCVEAILYMVLSDQTDISITKRVYPHVAAVFKTGKKNVEKNIRVVIEKVWAQEDEEKLRRLYPYGWSAETGKPTNAEFLEHMTRELFINNL